jgi:hypothetical protein
VAAEAKERMRGVVLGRSLNFRPDPPDPEVLGNAVKLTDVEMVTLPQKSWRDQLRLFLQASGLTTIPQVTRLRWQAHEVTDWLQGTLIGKGRGRKGAMTHPTALLAAIDFLMGMPNDLEIERRMIQMLIGRALVEYRKRVSANRERPMSFAKEASNYFATGFRDQQLVSKAGTPAEQFIMVQNIYNNYYYFRCHYIFHILSREPAESGNKLFSKFMRSSFFLSTIQDDGTIAPKPSYRALPPKEHVVFLAKRDVALQTRLREDESLRSELQQVMKYFRSVRSSY